MIDYRPLFRIVGPGYSRVIFSTAAYVEINLWIENNKELLIDLVMSYQVKPTVIVREGDNVGIVTAVNNKGEPVYYVWANRDGKWECMDKEEVMSLEEDYPIQRHAIRLTQALVVRDFFKDQFVDTIVSDRPKHLESTRRYDLRKTEVLRECVVRWNVKSKRYVYEHHEGTGLGTPKGEHFVNEHLRQYKSGKITIVKPHKRGHGPLKTVTRIIGEHEHDRR